MGDVLLVGLLIANAVTFAAFGLDKWRARRRSVRRIRERTLLWFAFLGGMVGAWCGVSVFRHKTRKREFLVRLVLVTIVNAAWPFLWWHWRGGG